MILVRPVLLQCKVMLILISLLIFRALSINNKEFMLFLLSIPHSVIASFRTLAMISPMAVLRRGVYRTKLAIFHSVVIMSFDIPSGITLGHPGDPAILNVSYQNIICISESLDQSGPVSPPLITRWSPESLTLTVNAGQGHK